MCETSIGFYRTMCHIPEDCNVQQSYNAVYSEDKNLFCYWIINWDCTAEY